MKKKLISLLTSVSLCAGLASFPINAVNAADPATLHDVIMEHFDGMDPLSGFNNLKLNEAKTNLVQDKVEVPTDMQVKPNGTTEWKNDDTVSPASEASYNFDYQTIMKMQTVKALYDKYIELAQNLIDVSGYSNAAALKDQLNDVKVEGQYIVTVSFPENSGAYEKVVTDELDNAAVQNMFKLVNGSTVETLDKLYNVTALDKKADSKQLVVTLDVVNGTKANLDSYLAYDIVMEKDAVALNSPESGSVSYTMAGTVTGYTDIKHNDDVLAHIEYEAKQDAQTPDTLKPEEIAATVTLTKATPTPTPTPTRRPGGSHGSGTVIVKPTATPTATPTIAPTLEPDKMVSTPSKLNADEHYSYIIGYEDGTVRPENSISREEVATVLFRMLTADTRSQWFTKENSFADVDAQRWSNNAISTLAAGGIVEGYENGEFRPSNKITRAEFVTMAGRFYEELNFPASEFSDINGHWAQRAIDKAVYYRLIEGYSDNTFRPDDNITRAEVMTIVNNILNRAVDKDGLAADAIQWSDNTSNDWFYYEVLEATNSHDFERREADRVMENWTKVNPATDWEALEKTWTTGTEVQDNITE